MIYTSVLSRQEIEAIVDLKSVPVISIVGIGTRSVKLNNPLKVLTLVFDDVIAESVPEGSHYAIFNRSQAKDIIEFIKSIPDGLNVLIHCEGGVSRSAGVARGLELCELAVQQNFDKRYWSLEDHAWKNAFHPNPTVVSLIVDEFQSQLEDDRSWSSHRDDPT